MSTILLVVLAAAIVAVLIPIVVFAAECFAALTARWPAASSNKTGTRAAAQLAVVIPAHNEEAGIGPTLESILPQLQPTDRLVVVADNCTDRTAEIARGYRVSVVERMNLLQRGKGYAMDAGLAFLDSDPPDVLIFVDADCQVAAGSMAALALQVCETGGPAQAVYLMDPPPSPTTGDRISAFAFLVKNLVRPLGLSRLGLPCLLTGAGMAFRWDQIRRVPLASGNIVEDMQLGLDLALAGHPPRLCSAAFVTSTLPSHASASRQQRRRWEHGHLETIRRQLPRFCVEFLRRPRLATLATALELAVPPLSLLVGLCVGVTACAAVFVSLSGNAAPLICCGIAFSLLFAALFAAWLRFGTAVAPTRCLLSIPRYAVGKAGLYWSAVWKPERSWVRTDRGPKPQSAGFRPADLDLSNKVTIGQSQINNVSMAEAFAAMEMLIKRRRPSFVVTPNVDHVVRLESDAAFRAAYEDAHLVVADGMPLLWAAKLLRTPLKEKVSGSDLFPRFCRVAAEKGYRLYFLGGRPGAAEATANKLRRAHPDLQIAVDCPVLGFDRDPQENGRVVERIRQFAPDVLFVGLGAPKQELWMHRHHADCRVPVSVGIGGTFDFEAGYVRRAPRLLQRTGFEWLWRLLSEPRRMYRRYLIDDPKFLAILWRQMKSQRADLAVEQTATPISPE